MDWTPGHPSRLSSTLAHSPTSSQHIISKPVFTPAQRRRNRSIVRVRLISPSIRSRRVILALVAAATTQARPIQQMAVEIQQRQSRNEWAMQRLTQIEPIKEDTL